MTVGTIGNAAPTAIGGGANRQTDWTVSLYHESGRAANAAYTGTPCKRLPRYAAHKSRALGACPTSLSHSTESYASSGGWGFESMKTGGAA